MSTIHILLPQEADMTRDLQEIKQGLAQVRAALYLLESFIAEYETRTVNILTDRRRQVLHRVR